MKNDVVEFVLRGLYDESGRFSVWGESMLNAYKRVARFSFFSSISWHATPKNYLIVGSRVFNKLSPSFRQNVHVVLSARDPFRISCIPRSFSYNLTSYKLMVDLAESGRSDLLNAEIKRIQRVIGKINPKAIVVNSTQDPINRLWLAMAYERGIKSICLQHGIYSSDLPQYAIDENVVDKYIALDRTQMDIVSGRIPHNKIDLLGYQSSFEWSPPSPTLKLCFVGEDWERYGEHDKKKLIIDTYRLIILELSKSGRYEFFYKKHPSESGSLGFEIDVNILDKRDLGLPDVYIGFSSSLLKDVSSIRKLAIQIIDLKISTADFSKSGYCISVANDSGMISSIEYLIGNDIQVPCVEERLLDNLLVFDNNL